MDTKTHLLNEMFIELTNEWNEEISRRVTRRLVGAFGRKRDILMLFNSVFQQEWLDMATRN